MRARPGVIFAIGCAAIAVLVAGGLIAGQERCEPGPRQRSRRSTGLGIRTPRAPAWRSRSSRTAARPSPRALLRAGQPLRLLPHARRGDARVREGARGAAGVALALRFLGRNPRVGARGRERAPGAVNYLRGDDPAAWQTQISPATARSSTASSGRGIDLRLHEQAGVLKYEFRVRPGRPACPTSGSPTPGRDGLALEPRPARC